MARYYKKRRTMSKRRRPYTRKRYARRGKVSRTMRNFGAVGKVSVTKQLNEDIRVFDTIPLFPAQVPAGQGIPPGWMAPVDEQWGTNQVRILNAIEQGAGITNRIGAIIRMKSLQLKLTVRPNPYYIDHTQQNGEFNKLRCMVVYDRSPNGTPPAARSLVLAAFPNADGTINPDQRVDDGVNMYQKKRFLVIMDESWILPPCSTMTGNWPDAGGVAAGPIPGASPHVQSLCGKGLSGPIIERFIPLKGLVTEYAYDKPLENIYDMLQTGALWLIAQTDFNVSGAAVAASIGPWAIDFQARLRFYP